MGKRQVIEAIRARNRGADQEFLASFDDDQLNHYLLRLNHLSHNRGSTWVRQAETTAIVQRIASGV